MCTALVLQEPVAAQQTSVNNNVSIEHPLHRAMPAMENYKSAEIRLNSTRNNFNNNNNNN
jgi:hypothetical protein